MFVSECGAEDLPEDESQISWQAVCQSVSSALWTAGADFHHKLRLAMKSFGEKEARLAELEALENPPKSAVNGARRGGTINQLFNYLTN